MPLSVLGLQAAYANGSEATFDGQSMQVGTHLRWSFAPELGFPPGAFWLARREANGEKRGPIDPPVAVGEALDAQPASQPNPDGLGNLVSTGDDTTSHERCGECGRCAGERASAVSTSIACCCCECGPSETDGGKPGWGSQGNPGTTTVGGTGWNSGKPGWDPPDKRGWRVWGEPFTLPVTRSNWPARYDGALDPSTHPEPVLLARDMQECAKRLTGLDLLDGMSSAAERQNFKLLREECVRLVRGWPNTPNYAVELQESLDGANAPQLSLRLVSQLQLAALNPYMARVLGLYFLDKEANPNEHYDYCIVGVWPTIVPPVVRSPGSAPAGALARGDALFDGMKIAADPAASRLYAWQSNNASTAPPATLTGVPSGVMAAMVSAVEPLTPGARPQALLAAEAKPPNFPFPPLPSDIAVCGVRLSAPVAEIAIGIAGEGKLTARSSGTEVASVAFSGGSLQWRGLAAPEPMVHPIDEIVIATSAGAGSIVVVGDLLSSPVAGAHVGVRYAIVHAPGAMVAPAAPSKPVTWFRRRTSQVSPSGPSILERSYFDVQWASPPLDAAEQSGDPVADPMALPRPLRTVGYLAQRTDGEESAPTSIPRMIAATPQPTPSDSPLVPTPATSLRFVDAGLPDPSTGYQHRTAGFGLFGQLGAYSAWSDARGVERIAAAPTLRLLTLGGAQSTFDNGLAGGGVAENPANPTAWVGGMLSVLVSWPASALLAYPDARSARLSVLDASSAVLVTSDFAIPAASVDALTLTALVPDPARGCTYAITDPPLTTLEASDPSSSLTLTGILEDGNIVSERFAVRPGPVDSSANVQPGSVVATLLGGRVSRVVSNPGAFVGQPAYLVSGVSIPLTVSVPLRVPIGQPTATGTASVAVSRASTFDANEQIVDPNTGASRPEPSSNRVTFVAAQRLTPPSPTAVVQPTPSHIVHHLYYEAADYNGDASYSLPFGLSALPGVSGYLLERAPAHSLFVADVQRRRSAGLLDPNPAIAGRADLQGWIGALPDWLLTYNNRLSSNLDESSVLTDPAGQRAFIEHFYGGLLDDELRALADVSGNGRAFAQVGKAIAPESPTLEDTVNGNGFGRNMYGLLAINSAGSRSGPTPSVGPIYTRTVRPSRAPVLYKVTPQPSSGALIVAWALDGSPDIAGYLVYRSREPSELEDLRWFGPDPVHPADPSTLALAQLTPGMWNPLSLTPGAGDPRLIGVVNDPRAFARDYDGSDMGEVALPPGPAPDEILGVYRLAEFDPRTPESQPAAFNYWTPGSGGTAQLLSDISTNPATSRVVGLRLGLGRGVAVVVVANYAGAVRTIGALPVLRAAFVDGTIPASSPSKPADPNAAPSWTAVASGESPTYVLVAIDIAGNQSMPSKPFAVPALVPA